MRTTLQTTSLSGGVEDGIRTWRILSSSAERKWRRKLLRRREISLEIIQRDTNGLNAENNELNIRLQTMERQVHLQDALNEALKEEIQHLKMLTGQAIPNGANSMMNFPSSSGSNQPFYSNNLVNNNMPTLLTAQQFQQLQIQTQKQHQYQHQLQQHQFHQQEQHHIGEVIFRALLPPSASLRQNASDLKAPLPPKD